MNQCMERVVSFRDCDQMFRWCSVSLVLPVSPECADGVSIHDFRCSLSFEFDSLTHVEFPMASFNCVLSGNLRDL